MTPHAMPQPHQTSSHQGTAQFSHSHSDSSDWTQEITQFAPVASTIAKVAGVLGFLAAAFLIYEIASGRAAQVTETGNVNTAAAVLNICAVAAAVGLIISLWQSRGVGPGLAVLGMVFMAAVPAFLPKPIHSIASLFQGGGFFLLILGLVKLGLDFAVGTSPKTSTSTVRTTPTPGQRMASQAAPDHAVGAALMPNAPGVPVASQPGPSAPGGHAFPAVPGLPHAAPHAQATPMSGGGAEIIDDGDQFGGVRHTMEKLDPIMDWVLRISAGLAAVSLLYLLYGIFAGRIGQPDVAPAIANNLKLAATVLQWSLILLAISVVWLMLDMPYLGLTLIAAGVALHLGAPWVLLGHVGKTNLIAALAGTIASTGFVLAIIGVLKQGYEVVLWALNLPNRMKQKADVGFAQQAEPAQRKVAREANMFSPCWKLPFCREVIRKQCPAFLAKKTCWKFGRGCYCDEEMIGRIIRGESLEVIKAPTRLSQKGKPPCDRCHIYLEHQGFKFKMLSPLTLPITVIFMYFIWPMYSKFFMAFTSSKAWDALSFDTSKMAPDAIKTDPSNLNAATINNDQVALYATMLIGVLLGFFVLVYVSKFIEWAIYKAKL